MKALFGLGVATICLTLACASTKPMGRPQASTDGAKPCAAELAKATHFGEPMRLAAADTVCIKKVFADRGNFDGKTVRVAGRVESVCEKKGCWMRLTDDVGSDTMFIKFVCPIQGRLIPMDAVGKNAVVEGTVEVATMSEAEARHYKEDAGASPDEVKKIVGPQKILRMKSAGAMIEDKKST